MTDLKSNSGKKSNCIFPITKGSDLQSIAPDFKVLDAKAVAIGIGRKATDAELMDYLTQESDKEPIDLEIAFSKYLP